MSGRESNLGGKSQSRVPQKDVPVEKGASQYPTTGHGRRVVCRPYVGTEVSYRSRKLFDQLEGGRPD